MSPPACRRPWCGDWRDWAVGCVVFRCSWYRTTAATTTKMTMTMTMTSRRTRRSRRRRTTKTTATATATTTTAPAADVLLCNSSTHHGNYDCNGDDLCYHCASFARRRRRQRLQLRAPKPDLWMTSNESTCSNFLLSTCCVTLIRVSRFVLSLQNL